MAEEGKKDDAIGGKADPVVRQAPKVPVAAIFRGEFPLARTFWRYWFVPVMPLLVIFLYAVWTLSDIVVQHVLSHMDAATSGTMKPAPLLDDPNYIFWGWTVVTIAVPVLIAHGMLGLGVVRSASRTFREASAAGTKVWAVLAIIAMILVGIALLFVALLILTDLVVYSGPSLT